MIEGIESGEIVGVVATVFYRDGRTELITRGALRDNPPLVSALAEARVPMS
jgi:hypothetical protein